MKFLLYDFLAALISLLALVFGAYAGGEYIDQVFKVAKDVQAALIAVSILAGIYIVIKIRQWIRRKTVRRLLC